MKPIRKHARTLLRQVSSVRVEGFQTMVDDLGTHLMHGVQVPYSRQQVFFVLTGRSKSARLMRRIAQRRPDAFGLHYVPESVRAEGLRLAEEEAR